MAMKLYLVDTNILIYAFHGERPYAEKIREWIKKKQLLLSAIVAAEFLAGAESEEAEQFEAVLDRFGAAPVDLAVARLAANYKKGLTQRKPGLKLPDALLAATAKIYGAVLVTENPKDFPMKDIALLNLH